MKYIKISVQNKSIKSADYQTIVSVDDSEVWKSTSFRWMLPRSEYAVRVNGTGKGSCSFRKIQFISEIS